MTDDDIYRRGYIAGLTFSWYVAEGASYPLGPESIAAAIKKEITKRREEEEEARILAAANEEILQAERKAGRDPAETAAQTKIVMMLPVINARLAELEKRMDEVVEPSLDALEERVEAVELRSRPAEWGTEK